MMEGYCRETAMRNEVCEIGKRMWQRGLIAAFDGNISVRMPDGRILCTPTGVSKGFLKPEELVVINRDGSIVSGVRGPSSEIKMHLTLYDERVDAGAVVHAHPPYATGFALAEMTLPKTLMPEIDGLLGRVELLDYATPGSDALAKRFRKPARQGINVFLLSRHGATTIGSNLEEAWFRMESLEQCCQIAKVAFELEDLFED